MFAEELKEHKSSTWYLVLSELTFDQVLRIRSHEQFWSILAEVTNVARATPDPLARLEATREIMKNKWGPALIDIDSSIAPNCALIRTKAQI